MCLIHGLEGGRQAVLLRIHHCLMDGFAAILVLDCIFSDHGSRLALHEWGPVGPAARPARLVAAGLRSQARALRRLPALVRQTRQGMAAAKAADAAAAVHPPTEKDMPVCSLSLAYTSKRSYARATLPLAELRLVKRAAGVTVNDVALAVVAGSLRAYLEARSDLPAAPLIATVPVSTEATTAVPRTFGNHFAALTTSLATDVADPWERLHVISTTTAQAKRLLSLIGPEVLSAWLDLVPPAVLDRTTRRHNRRRRTDPGRATANLVVSNVRGPRLPCSFGGTAIDDMYMVGPPNDGLAANVTLADLGDTVSFTILSYADAVENPREIADGLHASLGELVGRARALPADRR
jgi:WS/DGAT/MGAT family acyltransferase